MNKLLLILSFTLFISCGKTLENLRENSVSVQKVDPVDEEKFSYELDGIACSTGKHKFAKHEQACTALKNDYCAQDEREDLFLSEQCSGLFDS